METTIAGLRDLIVDKLEAIQIDGDDAFKSVTGYADGNFNGYPAAVVIPVGGQGAVADTHRNMRTFQFVISLYQEQSEAGADKERASDVITAVSDAVLQAFDNDQQLGGQVGMVRVVEFDTTFKVAAGTFNFANFRVDCVVLVTRN